MPSILGIFSPSGTLTWKFAQTILQLYSKRHQLPRSSCRGASRFLPPDYSRNTVCPFLLPCVNILPYPYWVPASPIWFCILHISPADCTSATLGWHKIYSIYFQTDWDLDSSRPFHLDFCLRNLAAVRGRNACFSGIQGESSPNHRDLVVLRVPRCYASLVFSEAWPNLDRQSIFLVVSSGHLNSFGNHDISQTSLVIGKLCKFLPYNDFFFAVNLSTQNYL